MKDNSVKSIERNIVGFEVVKPAELNNAAPLIDDNPLCKRIDSRPPGEMESVCEKVEYYTFRGRQTVYLVTGFMPVDGVVNGRPCVIERPLEFFLPASQNTEDQQWITATMRSLSLAARAGFAAKILQDLRKVAWDKGLVRCGHVDYETPDGKKKRVPKNHDSEVATIAWALQQQLYRRGFLDAEGNQRPVETLIANYQARLEQSKAQAPDASADSEAPPERMPVAKQCPQCRNFTLVMQAGCETCTTCEYTRCA
jgi:ribonucleoside-diphosphate reductase alpha chain